MFRTFIFGLFLCAFTVGGAEPFAWRGYYLTFMRMPAMGLGEWKQAVDCFAEDDANVIVLWMGGGFRSKKFPITWKYNEEHANVRQDFARDLIDYAHRKGIKVLLGFTPFGYDGVNQYGIEHPGLKAKKADGSVVDQFGIHCWGWNLCAAREESQRFMREYISEMCFDFYPNADGLLVESSDYNICRCENCGARYYDNEFKFVRWISDEVWQRKKDATILVYPHYFTGKKVPGLDVNAARQEFDSRWGLSFAPHSSHFEPDLIARARTSFYWSDAPILGTPRGVAAAAKAARDHRVNGLVPSMEAFSYVPQKIEGGEPWLVGRRKKPWGLDVSGEGKMPYRSLMARVARFAVQQFSANPDLDFGEFEKKMAVHFFGADDKRAAVADLLAMQQIWTHDTDWYFSSPLLDPEFFRARAKRLKWSPQKLADYDQMLKRLHHISESYSNSTNRVESEMARHAKSVLEAWAGAKPSESAG